MNVTQTVPLLLVSQFETSLPFYRDGLGFQVDREWSHENRLAWCWLTQGTASLMLQQATAEDPPAASWGRGMTLYFLCDDASEAYRQFQERGIDASPPTETFYHMNQVFVSDPDGYRLCFENPTEP